MKFEHLYQQALQLLVEELRASGVRRWTQYDVHQMQIRAAIAVFPTEEEDVEDLFCDAPYLADALPYVDWVLEEAGQPSTHHSKMGACVVWHIYRDLDYDIDHYMQPTIVVINIGEHDATIQEICPVPSLTF